MGENLISDHFRRILLETYLVYALILKKVQQKHLYPQMTFFAKTALGLDISIPTTAISAVLGRRLIFYKYKWIHINIYFTHVFFK